MARRSSRFCEGCGSKVPRKEVSPFRGHRKECPWKEALIQQGFIFLHYTTLEGWGEDKAPRPLRGRVREYLEFWRKFARNS